MTAPFGPHGQLDKGRELATLYAIQCILGRTNTAMGDRYEHVSDVLQDLSHPIRLHILDELWWDEAWQLSKWREVESGDGSSRGTVRVSQPV